MKINNLLKSTFNKNRILTNNYSFYLRDSIIDNYFLFKESKFYFSKNNTNDYPSESKHTHKDKVVVNPRTASINISQSVKNKSLHSELTSTDEKSPVLDSTKTKKINNYRVEALNKTIWRKNAFYKSIKIKRAIEDELNGPPDSFDLRDKEDLLRFYRKDMDNKQYFKLNERWQNKLYKRRLMKANTKFNYDNFVSYFK
jgi:hypothetical protein